MAEDSHSALRRWTRQVNGAAERASRVRAELIIAHNDGVTVDAPALARAVGDLDRRGAAVGGARESDPMNVDTDQFAAFSERLTRAEEALADVGAIAAYACEAEHLPVPPALREFLGRPILPPKRARHLKVIR